MFNKKIFKNLDNWIQVGSIIDYMNNDSSMYHERFTNGYFSEDICQFSHKESGIVIDAGVYNSFENNDVFPGYTLLVVDLSKFPDDPAAAWSSPIHKSIHFTSSELIDEINYLLKKYN